MTFTISGVLSDTLDVSRRTWLDNFYDPDHFLALHRRTYGSCAVISRSEELVEYELGVRFLGMRLRSRAAVTFLPPDTVRIHATGALGMDTETFWRIVERDGAIEATCRYAITLPSWLRPLAPWIRRTYERQNRALWDEDVPALRRIERLTALGYVDPFPSPVPRLALQHCRPRA